MTCLFYAKFNEDLKYFDILTILSITSINNVYTTIVVLVCNGQKISNLVFGYFEYF